MKRCSVKKGKVVIKELVNINGYLLIRDSKSSILTCEFPTIGCGPLILGQGNLRIFQGKLSILTTEDGSNEMLDNFNYGIEVRRITHDFKALSLRCTSTRVHDPENKHHLYYCCRIQRPGE